MGTAVSRADFSESDYQKFAERLPRHLHALRLLLQRPGFGHGPPTIGAELEMFLVDRNGEPLCANQEVLAELPRKWWTTELGSFNLECNTRPYPLAGRPFTALAQEMDTRLHQARQAAARHGGRVVIVGILPTLKSEHFDHEAITDLPRYRAMNAGLLRLRREPFHVQIHGEDDLRIDINDAAFEGANIAFQIHLRVTPEDFRNVYNAAQIATPVVLAVAGNSPIFLGRRLWEDTRIALFKQAVDDRDELERSPDGPPPRVWFGRDWVKDGIYELFAETVRCHAPIVPMLDDEDPVAVVQAGGVPRLFELRLHNGTVWRWNRPVYDPEGDGHIRIEFRALSSGPTITDTVANGAFLIGLTLALAPRAATLTQQQPFASVHANFYRAARNGLDAELTFPDKNGRLTQVRARDLATTLLPLARQGLLSAGVMTSDCDETLAIIAARLKNGQTGARWMKNRLAQSTGGSPPDAKTLADLLAAYSAHSQGGLPVHAWPGAVMRPGRTSRPPLQPQAPLVHVERPAPDRVPDNVMDFLHTFHGPTWMILPGVDRSRMRVVTTLMHGNEPSGITAIHQYLRSQRKPAVDTAFYIAQIETALHAPQFAHRMLPGRRDFNRCFAPPFDDEEGQRAWAFMFTLAAADRPIEALIDLHNNTGRSPAYGVSYGIDNARLNITDLFGDFYIDSDIRLRTLIEFAEAYCPSVTIECGTAGDPAADAVALAGLERFLSMDDLQLHTPAPRHIKVLHHPVRVHVRSEIDIAYAEHPPDSHEAQAPLILRADLERWNFAVLPTGACIGWVRPGTGWPLDARGADGVDVSRNLFAQIGQALRTSTPMIPVMMTSDPVVAKADCLFYAMNPSIKDGGGKDS